LQQLLAPALETSRQIKSFRAVQAAVVECRRCRSVYHTARSRVLQYSIIIQSLSSKLTFVTEVIAS